MARLYLTILLLTIAACALNCRSGEITALPPFIIEGTLREGERQSQASRTLSQGLLRLSGLTVDSQGDGLQNDIRIRGSSFTQSGLAIGGLGLGNPQTEHFHSELPLSLMLFMPPRVFTGASGIRNTTRFATGTVALEFAPISEFGELEIELSEKGGNRQGFFNQTSLWSEGYSQGGLSVFGYRENSPGYDCRNNYHDRHSTGIHLQVQTPKSQTDIAAGRQFRRFGAGGFYGAPTAFPSEEQLRDSMAVVSSTWEIDNATEIRLTGLLREITDEYVFDRTDPGLYKNKHRSVTTAALMEIHRQHLPSLSGLYRLDAESQRLDSRGFGISNGLGNHERARAGLLVLPEWSNPSWAVALGLHSIAFSDDTPALLPRTALEYTTAYGQILSLAYSEHVRQPSYTELDYNSPGSLGNKGLEREESQNLEIGCRHEDAQLSCHAAVFFKRIENAVDWTWDTGSAKWTATNLESVKTKGLETEISLAGPELFPELSITYTWIHKGSERSPYASRYVLNYPEHTLRLDLSWHPAEWCELRTIQELQRWSENRLRDDRRTGIKGSLQCVLGWKKFPGAKLILSVSNLWNDQLEIFPGQFRTPRHWSAAARIRW